MSTPLKTSFRYLRRSPFQALAAISVLAITYFVMTLLTTTVYSVGQALTYFETRPQTIAFLKTEAKDEEIKALEQKLQSDSRVRTVRVVSREDALELYKNATKDNPLLGELVSPSIFPPSIEFSVTVLQNAQTVLEEVKKEPIVDTIGFTANIGGKDSVNTVIERLKEISKALRTVGFVAVGVLLVTSFLVLIVVMTMRTTMRKSEIESLSLLGATPGFIRTPIVLEALQYSIIGVVVGWLLAVILIMYVTPSLFTYFGEIPILPREMDKFFMLFGVSFVLNLVSALIIALASSTLAVSRSIRTIK